MSGNMASVRQLLKDESKNKNNFEESDYLDITYLGLLKNNFGCSFKS